MTYEERELLGKGLLEDSSIKDVIDYFGADKILDEIDDDDIVERVDSTILKKIDDDNLIEAVMFTDKMLDSITIDDIKDYLDDKGYSVIDREKLEEDFLKEIKEICRELQPNGYIGKEEAKNLICDYLDVWMTKCF